MLHVDFYYDFISPYSYLAATQVPDFGARNDVEIHWRPVLLPQLMQLAGNQSPATVRKKGLYLLRDLARWAELLGIPFKMQSPPFFDARPALCAAQALADDARASFSQAVFAALWSGSMAPDHAGWVAEILATSGLPVAWAHPADPDRCMSELYATTDTAHRAGAFGVPTFVLHGAGKPQLFWGVDRLDFLQRAIAAARP